MENLNLITNDTINEVLASIDEVPADSAVGYEVWALGYECDGEMSDTEVLLKTFDDPNDAILYATNIKWQDIRQFAGAEDFIKTSDMISVEVETVVTDEDGDAMNVGTIFCKTLAVLLEDIRLSPDDYVVLADGNLKVSCALLKDFNKNDKVRFYFIEEKSIITYKLISKVIYGDGEYYHCEFVY